MKQDLENKYFEHSLHRKKSLVLISPSWQRILNQVEEERREEDKRGGVGRGERLEEE